MKTVFKGLVSKKQGVLNHDFCGQEGSTAKSEGSWVHRKWPS